MSQPDADAAAPGQRLERLGYGSVSRKPAGGPKELTPKHRLLIEYQINGCMHRDLLQRLKRPKAVINETTGKPEIRDVSLEPGEPLTLIEAADVLRIRRRNARQLTMTRIYQTHMAEELQRFRDGEKAASLQTMVAMRDEPGSGKAADRKVRLEASKALIGEQDRPGGPTVNIYNGGTQITAGVVIRLPPSAQRTPLEQPAPTIEHEEA